MMNKATGYEAINALTHLRMGDNGVVITEHNAGIDVDNAGRGYDRERVIDQETLYWVTMLYVAKVPKIPGGWTVDDLFVAEYDVEHIGATDTKLRWFHINEDMFDSESRGTHFEFTYPEGK